MPSKKSTLRRITEVLLWVSSCLRLVKTETVYTHGSQEIVGLGGSGPSAVDITPEGYGVDVYPAVDESRIKLMARPFRLTGLSPPFFEFTAPSTALNISTLYNLSFPVLNACANDDWVMLGYEETKNATHRWPHIASLEVNETGVTLIDDKTLDPRPLYDNDAKQDEEEKMTVNCKANSVLISYADTSSRTLPIYELTLDAEGMLTLVVPRTEIPGAGNHASRSVQFYRQTVNRTLIFFMNRYSGFQSDASVWRLENGELIGNATEIDTVHQPIRNPRLRICIVNDANGNQTIALVWGDTGYPSETPSLSIPHYSNFNANTWPLVARVIDKQINDPRDVGIFETDFRLLPGPGAVNDSLLTCWYDYDAFPITDSHTFCIPQNTLGNFTGQLITIDNSNLGRGYPYYRFDVKAGYFNGQWYAVFTWTTNLGYVEMKVITVQPPTANPTANPTITPSLLPSLQPTTNPISLSPTFMPSSGAPTNTPVTNPPSAHPIVVTLPPTFTMSPTTFPSILPSASPSTFPSVPPTQTTTSTTTTAATTSGNPSSTNTDTTSTATSTTDTLAPTIAGNNPTTGTGDTETDNNSLLIIIVVLAGVICCLLLAGGGYALSRYRRDKKRLEKLSFKPQQQRSPTFSGIGEEDNYQVGAMEKVSYYVDDDEGKENDELALPAASNTTPGHELNNQNEDIVLPSNATAGGGTADHRPKGTPGDAEDNVELVEMVHALNEKHQYGQDEEPKNENELHIQEEPNQIGSINLGLNLIEDDVIDEMERDLQGGQTQGVEVESEQQNKADKLL